MNHSRSRSEPLVVGLLAACLYAATGARDVLWGDPTKLVLATHDFVFSLNQQAHVGSTLWARLFAWLPLEPYAWRTQIASAAASGVAFGFGHALLLGTGVSPRSARIGSAAAIVCHTIWFVSAMTESYAPALAVLALALWLVRARRLPFCAGFCLGAGALVHVLCLFSLPALLHGVWRSRLGRAGALRAAAGAALGFGLPVLAVAGIAAPRIGGASLSWVELTQRYADFQLPARNAPLLLGYLVYNFVGPALVLLVLGFLRMSPQQRTTGLLLVGAHYLVALFWMTQRSFLIPVPVYFACALPIALGAESLCAGRARAASLLLLATLATPILVYLATPAIVARLSLQSGIRDVPYRQELAYFCRPWKCGERSARTYLEALRPVLPERALVVGDFTTLSPLWYAQAVEGWRADLALYSIDQQSSERIEARLQAACASGVRVFVLDDETFLRLPRSSQPRERVPVAAVEQLSELLEIR